jgi:DNA-binding NarL/FixJ family response regulator
MMERVEASALTPRETEICDLIRNGMRNKEIAEVLGISEQDTKNRLRRIYDKLGVWSRTELAMLIVNRGPVWAGKD